MVSGRVVAIINSSSEFSMGYLICQKLPGMSLYSTSASDSAVRHLGHQFIMRLPL